MGTRVLNLIGKYRHTVHQLIDPAVVEQADTGRSAGPSGQHVSLSRVEAGGSLPPSPERRRFLLPGFSSRVRTVTTGKQC